MLVGWLVGWLFGWLVGWLVGCLVGWLVGWLVWGSCFFQTKMFALGFARQFSFVF